MRQVAVNDTTRVVDIRRADIDRMMSTSPQTDRRVASPPLWGARLVTAFSGGHAVGLKLYAIRSGSLLSALGLQNGDLLRAINDQSVVQAEHEPGRLDPTWRKAPPPLLDIDVVRHGRPVRILAVVHDA